VRASVNANSIENIEEPLMKSEFNHHAHLAAVESSAAPGTRPHVAVLFYRFGPITMRGSRPPDHGCK